MQRFTTPTHIFDLPIDTDEVSSLVIVYNQGNSTVLKKIKDDCELSGKTVKVTLTQEETSRFTAGVSVKIQMHLKTNDGSVPPTNILTVSCEECLDDEVIE